MHIEQAHEYGYHKPFLVEILVFHHLLDNYYLAVGRSHHDPLGVTLEISYWAAVKIQHNKPCHSKDYGKRPKRNLVIYVVI